MRSDNSNFLVYNLQPPHITFNFIMVDMVIIFIMVVMVMVVRTGRDKTDIET